MRRWLIYGVALAAAGLVALSAVAGAQDQVNPPPPPNDNGETPVKWEVELSGQVEDGKVTDYDVRFLPAVLPAVVETGDLKAQVRAETIREGDGGAEVQAVGVFFKVHGDVKIKPPPESPGAAVRASGFKLEADEEQGNGFDIRESSFASPAPRAQKSGCAGGSRQVQFDWGGLIAMDAPSGPFKLRLAGEIIGPMYIVTPTM